MSVQHDIRITFIGVIVVLICTIFYLYDFSLRTVVGTFETQLLKDLHINVIDFSLISSTSFEVPYTLMLLPAGLLMTRFGLKATVSAALLLCGGSVILFSFSDSMNSAMLFRAFMGAGAAFGFLAMLAAIYEWLPNRYAATFVGIGQFIAVFGPMAAAGPLNLLAQNGYSWESIFVYIGIFGLLLMVFALLLVSNNKHKPGASSFQVLTVRSTLKEDFFAIVKQPQAWYIGIYSATVYFAAEYLAQAEVRLYMEKLGYGSDFANNLISYMWIGFAFACPVLGFISDRIHRRKPVLIAAALFQVISLAGIVYFPLSHDVLIFLFVLLGAAAAGQSTGFATAADHAKGRYVPLAMSFNDVFIIMLVALVAPAVGMLLLALNSSGNFSVEDYKSALTLVFVLGCISLFVSLFLVKETYNKKQREMKVFGLEANP